MYFSWQFFSIAIEKEAEREKEREGERKRVVANQNVIYVKALRSICAIAIEYECVRTHLINIIHGTYVGK